MKIHHIGYAVSDIKKSIRDFIDLGYNIEKDLIIDEKRGVSIQFMISGEYRIELVMPLNDSSPISNVLKKKGIGPYHICYETNMIDKIADKFINNKFILIEKKSNAIAINNQNVIFLYKSNVGLIELLESHT